MAIALVQSNLSGNSTTTSNSVSCTGNFSSNTTAGNCLVVIGWVSCLAAAPTFAITLSTSGLTWTLAASSLQTHPGPVWKGASAIYFVPNAPSISSGTLTTFHSGFSGSFGTKTIEFSLFEFSGVSTGLTLDTSNNTNGTSSTPNAGTLTTTQSDLIIVSHGSDTGLISAGSGFTLGPNPVAVQYGQGQYAMNVSAGSIATSFSGTEAFWGSAAAAFLPGGPTAPSKVSLSGGPFMDCEGNPVSNGYLVIQPTNDAVVSQNGFTFQIVGGLSQKILLDNNAFVVANQSAWGTDLMTPSGTQYNVMLFTRNGRKAWDKPQTQTITGSSFNISNWIPN